MFANVRRIREVKELIKKFKDEKRTAKKRF